MKIAIVNSRGPSQHDTLIIVEGASEQAVLGDLLAAARQASREHLRSFCYQAHTFDMRSLMAIPPRGTEVPEQLAIAIPFWGPNRFGRFTPPTVRPLHEWLAENPQ